MRFVGLAGRQEGAVPEARPSMPSFREAFVFWLKLGFISFGVRPTDRDNAPGAGREAEMD
jgi:hypothetical protein